MRPRTWAVHGLLGALAVAALTGSAAFLLAARRQAERITMPLASSIPVAAAAPDQAVYDRHTRGASEGELGVAIRLIEALPKAKIDVPSLSDRQTRTLLQQHWRRHRTPFVGTDGELGRMVQSVGLGRSPMGGSNPTGKGMGPAAPTAPKAAGGSGLIGAGPSKAPTSSASAGQLGKLDDAERRERDVRTFGLGEGTYDQRECILAPPPAHLRFKVTLEPGALFRTAPAVLGEGEVTFEVAFVPAAGGPRRILGTRTVRGSSARYGEWALELAPLGSDHARPGSGGLGVALEGELELTTTKTSAEPAIALWGSPVVLTRKAQLPYNVLFIIVDAMRSDAIAATHDPAQDAQHKHAKHPPLDAWFEPMPEVAPELNRLAAHGTTWSQSWSAAMWTRPATVSIFTGLRSSHAGLDILALELIGDQRRNFYARRPPLLPLILRNAGATATAIVNNMYLCGSVGVGIDFGFEAVIDHRFQTVDTRNITQDAIRFLGERSNERFLLLLNYAAPHAPYVPGPEDLAAVKAAAKRPTDPGVVNYLGEVHKDDAAIGQVLQKLDELKLRDKTLVIVTADHGETMSAAHDMVAVDVAKGVPSGRFTHLSTMWEEAARVAMVMSLPGKIPSAKRIDTRVQTIDLLPTILEIEGLPIPGEVEGRSLWSEMAGQPLAERPVIIEGRGARSIIDGRYHLILRDPVARHLVFHGEHFERAVELYDLQEDPGERRDLAPLHPDLVASLQVKLQRVLSEKPASASNTSPSNQRLHFRFATAGKVGALAVTLHVQREDSKLVPVGIESRAIHVDSDQIRINTATIADRLIGFDLELSSTQARPTWEVQLDGRPWPGERIYAGPLGISERGLLHGLDGDFDRSRLDSPALPHVVATQELGLFITRDPAAGVPELEVSAEAQLEAQQAMQAWGYARKPSAKKP